MKQFWKKTLINLAVFALLFFGVIFFVLMPTYQRYTQDKSTDAKKKNIVEENNTKINSLQKIAKNSDEFEKIYQNVSNLWPDNLNVSEFMVQIEGLAKDTGLVIDSFSIEEQKTITPTKAKSSDTDDNATATKSTKTTANTGTKFTMTSKSEYSNVMDLILRMETLARLNAVSSINISAAGPSLSINIVGHIYYGK